MRLEACALCALQMYKLLLLLIFLQKLCFCALVLWSVHSEMGKLAQESSDKMQEIQENSVYYFMPEPTPDMQMQPRLVKTNLSQIAGYLMIRR